MSELGSVSKAITGPLGRPKDIHGQRRASRTNRPPDAQLDTTSVLAVFSAVTITATAAGLIVYPVAGSTSAMLACALVLCSFALSLCFCQHLSRKMPTWLSATNTEVDQLERLQDQAWELRESEARYRDLLDVQTDAICRRNTNGEITFANRAFCQLFGVEPANILMTPFQPELLRSCEPNRSTNSDPLPIKAELTSTTNGPRWISWERHVLPSPVGQGREAQEIGKDVTELYEAARSVIGARDVAQAANRAKSRFLASMSHEIRTPMNGILGMTGLLLETRQSPEQINYCQAIEQSARTLLTLIDEILDFSKIEAGKITLKKEPFALHDAIQSTVDLLATRAHEKDLEIAWTVDHTLPSLLVGDQARIRQILLNLIANALKFTDRGGVLVDCALIASEHATNRVAIQIKDTGIGIGTEALEGIFAEYEQANTAATTGRGGTGLGLAISQRLARAMGGNITVVSSPGRGTTFTVELELGAVEGAQTLSSKRPAAATATHVLLAFSRVIERRALAHHLRAMSICVTECDSPESIASIRNASAAGHPIDLIIVDADSDPIAAGHCLTAARQAAPDLHVRGILMINAIARTSLAQFRAEGFESYLVRPVRPATLLRQIQLDPAGSTAGESEERPDIVDLDQTFQGIHVLVAEDNEINALLASRLLEKMGCTNVVARDGRQAVDAMKRSHEGLEKEFDLVLMDIQMPKLGGLEAAAAIRQLATADSGQNIQIPAIVAVTANAFEEDRMACLAAGLDDYLAKPFDRRELEQIIIKWCEPKFGTAQNPPGSGVAA